MKTRYLSAVILISGLLLPNISGSQNISELKRISEFALKTKDWLEGYTRSTGGNDFSYHSFRNDLSDCMLTRCTTGEMAVEWETQVVPEDFKAEGAGFVWIAALDINPVGHRFDVFINGTKRFQIESGEKNSWELSTEEGGKLTFLGISNDQHGDAHGYMTLWTPKEWIVPGKPVNIRIAGNAEGSSAWIIIYKAKDALAYLQNSVKYNTWTKITAEKDKNRWLLTFKLPIIYSGKKIKLKVSGKEYSIAVSQLGENGYATLSLVANSLDKSPLSLSDELDDMLSVNSLSADGEFSSLAFRSVIQNQVKKINANKTEITSTRTYYPKTVESLVKLSESRLAQGKIYLMNSSHQDIAWMDSPEKCIIERDTLIITPLIEMANQNPGYRFDIEDALMLREYIQRHPDKKEDLKKLLLNGQISCGSSYIQPYEEMYSGEALVRQFYLGAGWLKKEFGYSANTYWNLDVPGKTLQMPQILRKSGTRYMAISRFGEGVFKWYSPDGSYVTTYSPGHYANAFSALQKNFFEAAEFIAGSAMTWDKYYDTSSKVSYAPLLSDWDMSATEDYSGIINQWNNISEIQKNPGDYSPVNLPEIEMTLVPRFIEDFEKNANIFKSVKGERPAVWLYIHGPAHQKAIKASREGDILLTVAEKFATINALVDKTFAKYPEKQLQQAWEAKIYPDHGWGGKHGDITDALFQSKYEFARSEAEKIVTTTLNDLSSKIKTSGDKGIPVVVFNSLSWIRNDPASFIIRPDQGKAQKMELTDADGTLIPIQLSNVKRYDDYSIKEATVHFIATGIPSVGYKTWYLKFSDGTTAKGRVTPNDSYENQFYNIKLTNGGLSSIFDKGLGKELLNTQKFNGGEIFTMHSEGTGAGEFADIQQPDMKNFDRAANYTANWSVAESGEVFTCFSNRQPILNAVIEQKIRIYNTIKRIDFVVDLLNYEGVLYREYRMALPLNMEDGQVSYEVPFGVVNVGKDEMEGAAGERYQTICREIHPRGIENWIGASNSEFGVTLSSSVAVADYIDPTDQPSKNRILQPILLASRRSCHGEGNEYLQTGDHHFEFSLTSHPPGWENGFHSGRQANEKLRVVVDPKPYQNAGLPEESGFFNTSSNNIIISTVKKAENGSAAVFRVFNISGDEKNVQIKSFNPFQSGSRTNMTEEIQQQIPVNAGTVNLEIGKHSIETFMLK